MWSLRSSFCQFSLCFRECLLSVSFSEPSWVHVALHCIYATLNNSWETWEWGFPSHSLILCTLYISFTLCLPLNFWNPCQPLTSVLKWERWGSINIRVKTKNLTAKPNTSQRKQNSFGFAMGICFCREVFGLCCEVFGFAMRFLVLLWGILFLLWGFWFCHDSCGPPYVLLVWHKLIWEKMITKKRISNNTYERNQNKDVIIIINTRTKK